MKNIFFICMGLLMVNITLAQNGNVGIGTTTPTERLHVAGSVKIVDGTQGADKVLTSDATGKATWRTITAPSSSSSSDAPWSLRMFPSGDPRPDCQTADYLYATAALAGPAR